MIDVKKMCSEKGLRMTEQRNTIADVITEMSVEGHPDVNEIFLNANKKDKNISIATVYRTVKLFEEYGAIEKLEFETGEIHEFTNDEIEAIQTRVASELGFKLVDHRLELYGVKKKNKN